MPYNESTYRESLLDSATFLETLKTSLLSKVCDIMMAGELKEWSDSIPEDEEFDIDLEVFEGCDDENIKLMMKLFHEVEFKQDYLLNINAISSKELEVYRNEKISEISNKKKNNTKDDELPF
jgi:hypothetical protein